MWPRPWPITQLKKLPTQTPTQHTNTTSHTFNTQTPDTQTTRKSTVVEEQQAYNALLQIIHDGLVDGAERIAADPVRDALFSDTEKTNREYLQYKATVPDGTPIMDRDLWFAHRSMYHFSQHLLTGAGADIKNLVPMLKQRRVETAPGRSNSPSSGTDSSA